MKNNLAKWALKAWPFFIIILISLIHWLLSLYLSHEAYIVLNKHIAAIAQIFGGCIIVYNLNSNLGLFNETTLYGIMINWIESCPLRKDTKKNSATLSVDLPCFVFAAEGTNKKELKFIEEKVDELFRLTEQIRQDVINVDKRALERTLQLEQKLKKPIEENKQHIETLKSKVYSFSLNGISAQMFGVLLVIYGAVVPLI